MRYSYVMVLLVCLFTTPALAYDFDGDGTEDILWRDSDGVVAVWLMNGGIIQRSSFLGGVPLEWNISLVADVDGDGKSDVIWRHDNGTVAVWLMDGVSITAVRFPGSAAPGFGIQP